MNLWLDDLRDPKEHGRPDYIWITTAEQAIDLIDAGVVTSISFDHDLGTELTGYDVAELIEIRCAGGANCPKWDVHSANPVGALNIKSAMRSAERFAAARS